MKVFWGLVIQKVAGNWSVLSRLEEPLVSTPRLYRYWFSVSMPSSYTPHPQQRHVRILRGIF